MTKENKTYRTQYIYLSDLASDEPEIATAVKDFIWKINALGYVIEFDKEGRLAFEFGKVISPDMLCKGYSVVHKETG